MKKQGNKSDRSDAEIVRELAEKSGNTFHARVVRSLRALGWTVSVSPYYADGSSGKPREIDVVAEKTFPVVKNVFGTVSGSLVARLFMECKYVQQPTLFWVEKQNRDAAMAVLERRTNLTSTNMYSQKHHYLSEPNRKVAKLYASANGEGTENEQMFKALNQTLNAMIGLRETRAVLTDEWTKFAVDYPVVCCDSFQRFFETDLDAETAPLPLTRAILLDVNYAYPTSGTPRFEQFIVDVVPFDSLPVFDAVVKSDMEIMGFLASES